MLNHEEFLGQRLSPQGWERRKQYILREAREARTQQLRECFFMNVPFGRFAGSVPAAPLDGAVRLGRASSPRLP